MYPPPPSPPPFPASFLLPSLPSRSSLSSSPFPKRRKQAPKKSQFTGMQSHSQISSLCVCARVPFVLRTVCEEINEFPFKRILQLSTAAAGIRRVQFIFFFPPSFLPTSLSSRFFFFSFSIRIQHVGSGGSVYPPPPPPRGGGGGGGGDPTPHRANPTRGSTWGVNRVNPEGVGEGEGLTRG